MAKPVVLDSTAVLAVLFGEPGATKVLDLLPGSLLSAVNLAEIQGRLFLSRHSTDQTWNRVLSMGFEVIPFSEEQARLSCDLFEKSSGKPRPALTLAERACLALALERDATVYTTSHHWKSLPINVEVVVIA